MKTATVKVYSLEELTGKAREKAMDTLREWQTEGEWWQFAYGDWQEKLEGYGYNDVDISFSGFWSQGDGASFAATVDIAKWIAECGKEFTDLLPYVDNISASITRNSYQDSHEYSVSASVEGYTDDDGIDKRLNKLEDAITEDSRELMRKIYRELEKECEGLMSDDCILEAYGAEGDNPIWFYANGKAASEIDD